ncbi:unnamed protein product, partial [Prorocentrum cordatum]
DIGLAKTLAAMQKQLDQLTKQTPPTKDTPSNGHGGGRGSGAEDKDEKPDALVAKANELETAIKACKSEYMEEARKSSEAQLREVRKQIEGQKSDVTQHANLGHKLARKESQLKKAVEEAEEQEKAINDATAKRGELQAKQIVLKAEIDDIRVQLKQSPLAGGGDFDFTIPGHLLEGKDEVKTLIQTDAFKQFTQLFAQPRTKQEPRTEAAGDGDGDAQMDDAFVSTAEAESFWEQHRGDKRVIVQALVAAKFKK